MDVTWVFNIFETLLTLYLVRYLFYTTEWVIFNVFNEVVTDDFNHDYNLNVFPLQMKYYIHSKNSYFNFEEYDNNHLLNSFLNHFLFYNIYDITEWYYFILNFDNFDMNKSDDYDIDEVLDHDLLFEIVEYNSLIF